MLSVSLSVDGGSQLYIFLNGVGGTRCAAEVRISGHQQQTWLPTAKAKVEADGGRLPTWSHRPEQRHRSARKVRLGMLHDASAGAPVSMTERQSMEGWTLVEAVSAKESK